MDWFGYIVAVVIALVVLIIDALFVGGPAHINERVGSGDGEPESPTSTDHSESDDQMSEFLWHGSTVKLEGQLDPRPNRLIGQEKAVFATNQRWLALVFIPRHTSDDLHIGCFNGRNAIAEVYEGAFDKVRGKSGYIYKLSSAGFHGDSRLGMPKYEFINENAVPILETEHVADVWEELQKIAESGELDIVPFAETESYMREHGGPMETHVNAPIVD